MARTYDAPDCIIDFISGRDLTDADYHLYGAGRALGWIRMAADAIEATTEQKIAEYHAYAGISAARTAIDAVASWLNFQYLDRRPSTRIDLARPDFRNQVAQQVNSQMLSHLETLGQLAKDDIDRHRQRAQHREGLAIVRGSPPEAWYLFPKGIDHPSDFLDLVQLLRGWAGIIETEICNALAAV